MNRIIFIEVAVFTPNAAIAAEASGADRIELCSGFAEGGLSPSAGCALMVREKLKIPIHVMVRPRVGDFVYDSTELLAMVKEIEFYRQIGMDGVVLGVLDKNGSVHTTHLKLLVAAAGAMSVTFHRAFDLSSNPLQELDRLIDCGVKRLLTSGCKPNAKEGLTILKKLVDHAGDAIGILPGGGISAENVNEIVQVLGVKEVHLSGKKTVLSPMANRHYDVSLCNPREVFDFQWYECDPKRIKAVRSVFEA